MFKMFIWGGISLDIQSEIYCLVFYDWSLFCYAVLSVLSSFIIISLRKRDSTLVKSVYQKKKKKKINFSTKTYVVGSQKNRLNETFFLSTQNIC